MIVAEQNGTKTKTYKVHRIEKKNRKIAITLVFTRFVAILLVLVFRDICIGF